MNNKKFIALQKKIDVLKNKSPGFDILRKIEQIEEELFFDKLKCAKRSENDFNSVMVSKSYITRINGLLTYYSPQIIIEVNKITIDLSSPDKERICPACALVLISVNGGDCCDQCGYIEPSQPLFYGEKVLKKPSKSKENSVDNYCYDWLILLQGKGISNVPLEVITQLLVEARNFCTNESRINFMLVRNIRCADIRNWLSKYKFTKYNKFISYIHMRITRELGYEVRPPQFTAEEEHIILSDWKYLSETYCREYKKLKEKNNKKKNNNPYYPVCIFFIVKRRFRDERANRLEEYVHKQSNETFRLRLQCWEKTCGLLGYNPQYLT